MTTLAPVLTPRGHLLVEPVEDAPALPSDLSRRLQEAFARGAGHGLLQLGAAEVGTALPPAFGYWRELGARYVSAVCGREDGDQGRTHTPIPPPPPAELERPAAAAPPMVGGEYLTARVPDTWRAKRPPRPQVTGHVGTKPPSGLGTDALLDFRMEVTLDGERLTLAEIEQLLAASDGLHLVRGRWVELDRAKLGRMLEEFRAVEKVAKEHGLDFAEAMRLLAGARVSGAALLDAAAPDWSRVVAGPWLGRPLEGLRRPEALARPIPEAR